MTGAGDKLGFSLTVRGTVRDATTRAALSHGIIGLSREHDHIASRSLERDGSFRLVEPALPADIYLFSIFADGHEGFRRAIHLDADREEDIGTADLSVAEYPAGVWGVLWDPFEDHPLTVGSVRLEQGDMVVGQSTPGDDGVFGIEMGSHRPMPPGNYLLVSDVHNYKPSRIPLVMIDEATTYLIGRVELTRTED